MYAARPAVERCRQVAGLHDVPLIRAATGNGLAAPFAPDTPLTGRRLADLVRHASGPTDDVRMLTDDGAAHDALFREVAGLLGRDVLTTPDGARVDRWPGEDEAPDAVAVDRATGEPVGWTVIQPPDLATPLPGWFDVDDGIVRHRAGVVALALPDGVALATRADFVTRRAAAHRLRDGHPRLATVAVTVRSGGFVIGDYRGTQRVHAGRRLASVLGDLPLYGCDLRLWLTWPAEAADRDHLLRNVADLAETTGATVWTPPAGGAVELSGDRHDLRAIEPTGEPGVWQAHRPDRATGEAAFRSGPDGRLVPVTAPVTVTVRATPAAPAVPSAPAAPAVPAVSVAPAGPAAGVGPATAAAPVAGAGPAAAGARAAAPVVAGVAVPQVAPPAILFASAPPETQEEPVGTPSVGVPWLRGRAQVTTEPFEAFVISPDDPHDVATTGLRTPDLFVLGHLDPHAIRPDRRARWLLRVRVDAGGAVLASSIGAPVPSRFQHLLDQQVYLLPAGRLGRARLVTGYALTAGGTAVGTGTPGGTPLRIASAGALHGVPGLPDDAPRWPGPRTAYAVVPLHARTLPTGWMRLLRRAPAVTAGRLLVEVRVPEGRAIDVSAAAELLGRLPSVQSRAVRLHRAGIDLVVPPRHYERITALRVFEPAGSRWRRRRDAPQGTLADVLAHAQRS
ncbi:MULTISPECIES: hypothetical protein [Catenuloplanes]|uniref:Uncharacterized protein n=1 Tax=Catenuloplanes niger TaxID=587534 RepID=A0AAE3ZXF3_9ACTN|nr:hypothetical protein [Catenuloplanes niger]MDR7325898.1 hypothetical protein [Catenuloplanes niger]